MIQIMKSLNDALTFEKCSPNNISLILFSISIYHQLQVFKFHTFTPRTITRFFKNWKKLVLLKVEPDNWKKYF